MMTNSRCMEIGDGFVVVDREGERERLNADTVVVTSGYVRQNALYEALEGKVPELHIIGDARKLKSCQQAVLEAAELARRI